MRAKERHEPIFSRQEQSIVYLFSRYWERIPAFKNKRITQIQMRFPDCWIEDLATGRYEAVEFEYGLNDYRSHLNKIDVKKLDGVKSLFIVYWEHDGDERDLRAKLKKSGIKPTLVCLKDYFSARVFKQPKSEPWQAAWTFSSKHKKNPQVYSLEKIQRAVKMLGNAVQVNDPNNKLYRVIGFDKSGADFIECDHWEKIRFFTTSTPFAEGQIPRRLFVKPNGCDYFNGYFDVKSEFTIVKPNNAVVQFWKDFYFYEYDPHHSDSRCLICDFKRLPYDKGKDMFDYLEKEGYSLHTQSSAKIDDPQDIAELNAITKRKQDKGR